MKSRSQHQPTLRQQSQVCVSLCCLLFVVVVVIVVVVVVVCCCCCCCLLLLFVVCFYDSKIKSLVHCDGHSAKKQCIGCVGVCKSGACV